MMFFLQHKFKILGFIAAIILVGLMVWGAYQEYKFHYENCISKGGTLVLNEEDQTIRCKLPLPQPREVDRSWKWPWE